MPIETVRKPVAIGLIALLTGLFLIFVFGPKLIDAPRVDPDHPFDTQATMERLSRILDDERPHVVDTDGSDPVIERLSAEIVGLGFTPIIDDAFHCANRRFVSCARVRNIGFWVTAPGPDAVMVASHHDSVPTGPGAADDGMGVASSLEIARILQGRALPRPLYILITDGEEQGLIGASRFVEHDPVAPLIGAVVSLEARGNRGPASMFETSDPNGRDLAALLPHPEDRMKGAVANSLSVDIYRAMPNGTDVTEYLTLDMDAANYAMTGHEAHYHTRYDTLEHLNPASVFHVGGSALAAVEGFMTVNAATPDSPKIYSDVFGLGVIALPQAFALPLVGLALILCAAALLRTSRDAAPLWRVLLLPFAALAVGTGAAVLCGIVVAAIRPESAFGTAWPIALRGLFLAVSLGAAACVARWLYRPAGADRYLVGAWAVLMVLGLIVSFVFFGGVVLFALPALFVIPGAVLLMLNRPGWVTRLAYALFTLAAGVTLASSLTMHVMAEGALFVETSAPLMALIVWVFIVGLPLMWRKGGSTRRPLIGAGITAVVFAVASLTVPAYSEDAPLGRSLIHVSGDDLDGAYFILDRRDPLPDSMADAAPFTRGEADSRLANVWTTPAPAPDLTPAYTEVLRNTVAGDLRTIELRITAPDADWMRIYAAAKRPALQSLSVNGVGLSAAEGELPFIECTGRTCRDLIILMEGLPALEPLELDIRTSAYGLDASADALLAARPDWITPQHDGDYRTHRSLVTIPVPAAP